MCKWVSGGLWQTQKLCGSLAPIGIDQPRLEQAGAMAMIAGRHVIAPAGGGEGQPTQAAGFGDGAAGLRIGGDGMLPEDDSGPDLATENQGHIVVLNSDDAWAKAQRAVRADAKITVRDALAGEDHGFVDGCGMADDERPVEFVGFVEALITGGADAGDAQRQPPGAVQSGQHLLCDDFTDRNEFGLAG